MSKEAAAPISTEDQRWLVHHLQTENAKRKAEAEASKQEKGKGGGRPSDESSNTVRSIASDVGVSPQVLLSAAVGLEVQASARKLLSFYLAPIKSQAQSQAQG